MLIQRNTRHKILAFLLVVVLVGGLAVVGMQAGWLQDLENRTWDWRARLMAQPSQADPNIKLVIVDQSSLDFIEDEYDQTWPIPRSFYAAVIKFLEHAGARGLAMDLVLSESSAHAVEEDVELAEAISTKMPVVIAVPTGLSERLVREEKLNLFRKRQSEVKLPPSGVMEFSSATLPVSSLLERASAFGSVYAEPDNDGIYRHYIWAGNIKGVPVSSLAFALHNAVTHQHIDVSEFLNRQNRLTLKFHGPQATYQTVSIARVIQSYAAVEEKTVPSLDPKVFKDAWVFLGVWAPGLGDLRPTSLDEKYRGVEVHAAALDNLLHHNFVREVPFIWSVLYALCFISAVSAVVLFTRIIRYQTPILGLIVLTFCLFGYSLAFNGYWIPMFIPFAGMLCAALISLAFQYRLEGREHKFVKEVFRHYVSPAVIDRIVENPSAFTLGGERKPLTIFFSDIVGFTGISERIEVVQLVKLLNEFLTAMTDIILKYGGTVDKYVGDAIVAFWNAPLPLPAHAKQGVLAALESQAYLAGMQAHFEKTYGVAVKMRVGLHTGVVSVGNFGSKARFNYTVVGDSANLASRLEGANKMFGTNILISDATYAALEGEVACRKVADIRVVGRSQAVAVYEPRLAGSTVNTQDLSIYQNALERFEAGDLIQAGQLFSKLPNDSVARAYLTRLQGESGKAQWSAVWNLSEK